MADSTNSGHLGPTPINVDRLRTLHEGSVITASVIMSHQGGEYLVGCRSFAAAQVMALADHIEHSAGGVMLVGFTATLRDGFWRIERGSTTVRVPADDFWKYTDHWMLVSEPPEVKPPIRLVPGIYIHRNKNQYVVVEPDATVTVLSNVGAYPWVIFSNQHYLPENFTPWGNLLVSRRTPAGECYDPVEVPQRAPK